MSKDPLIY
jgi:DNA replication licensing factor MCM5